jgi:hypothetical protein
MTVSCCASSTLLTLTGQEVDDDTRSGHENTTSSARTCDSRQRTRRRDAHNRGRRFGCLNRPPEQAGIDAGGDFVSSCPGRSGPSRSATSVRPRRGDLMQIRRAEAADEEALAGVRRRAILALAVPAMSMERAARRATRPTADRIARAIREHDVGRSGRGHDRLGRGRQRPRRGAVCLAVLRSPRGRLSPSCTRRNRHQERRLRYGASRVEPERARFLPREGLRSMRPTRRRRSISVAQISGIAIAGRAMETLGFTSTPCVAHG